MDDLILKRFALSLKSPQHASAAIQKHFPLKQAIRDCQFTVHTAGFLFAVNTQGDPNTTCLAVGNCIHQSIQGEVLSSVED